MTDKRPRINCATGFGDQMMWDDEEEVVYTCKSSESEHSGKQIGTVPVTCGSWAGAQKNAGSERLAELDRLIAAREQRTKNRNEEER